MLVLLDVDVGGIGVGGACLLVAVVMAEGGGSGRGEVAGLVLMVLGDELGRQ